MAVTRISTAAGGAAATAILNLIDAGAGAGQIRVYTGSQPATPETAITSQVLLGTLTLSDPAGTVSGKTLTFSPIAQDDAAASGTIAWCRVVDSDGTGVIDGDASALFAGGTFQFNTLTVVEGGPIVMASGSLTVG